MDTANTNIEPEPAELEDDDTYNLPDTIRVGAFDYTIEHDTTADIGLTASGVDGDCDPTGLIIRIRTDLTEQRKREVLTHEIIHAAIHQTGIPIMLEDGLPVTEELIVYALGFLLWEHMT